MISSGMTAGAMMDADVLFDRRAMTIPIPYADAGVQAALRTLGEPIALFGEHPVERRRRLQRACAERGLDAPPPLPRVTTGAGGAAEVARPATEFMTRTKHPEAEAVRREVATASFAAAKQRLAALRKEHGVAPAARTAARTAHEARLRELTLVRVSKPPVVARIAAVARGGLSFTQLASFSTVPAALQSTIAAASDDGTLSLWDAVSGQRAAVLASRPCRLSCVAAGWLPAVDRALLAAGGIDGIVTASLGRVASPGVTNAAVAEADADDVANAAASSSSSPLSDDVATVQLAGHVGRVTGCAVNAQGRLLATAAADGLVRLWDARTVFSRSPSADATSTVSAKDDPAAVLATLDCCAREALDVAFHPDGGLVAVADAGGYVHLADVRTGRFVLRCESHLGPATRVAFAPSGYHLATGGGDGAIKLFDLRACFAAATGDKSSDRPAWAATQAPLLTLAAHDDWVTSLAFAPDAATYARALVSTSVDGTIAAHSLLNGARLSRVNGSPLNVAGSDEPPVAVRSACFAVGETGRADLFSAAHDAALRCWSLALDDGSVDSSREMRTVAGPEAAATAAAAADTAPAVHGGQDAADDAAAADSDDDDSDDDLAALRLAK